MHEPFKVPSGVQLRYWFWLLSRGAATAPEDSLCGYENPAQKNAAFTTWVHQRWNEWRALPGTPAALSRHSPEGHAAFNEWLGCRAYEERASRLGGGGRA